MWAGIFLMIMAGAVAVTGFTFRPAPDTIATAVGQVRTPNSPVDALALRTRGMAGYVAYYHSLAVNHAIENRKKNTASNPAGCAAEDGLYPKTCYFPTYPTTITRQNLEPYMNGGYKANFDAGSLRVSMTVQVIDDTAKKRLNVVTTARASAGLASQRLAQMAAYISPMLRMIGRNYLSNDSASVLDVKLDKGTDVSSANQADDDSLIVTTHINYPP